jgi:hypothetical protein
MIVVGCGKSKLAGSAKAKDLYTGSLFRLARRYAELSGQVWVILSAAHGVIEPDVIVRSYDQSLPRAGAALEQWARKAACDIEQRRSRDPVGLLLGQSVEILAGVTYAGPLAAQLDALDIEWTQPLVGLGTGWRLRRLRQMADSLQALRDAAWEKGKDKQCRK